MYVYTDYIEKIISKKLIIKENIQIYDVVLL